MVNIVNIVGSGDLNRELNLIELASEIPPPTGSYDPEIYHGMHIRLTPSAPLVTVYTSGKYIIVGSASTDILDKTRSEFLEFLVELGVLDEPLDRNFEIRNMVAEHNIGRELELNTLTQTLSKNMSRFELNSIEYEPEQFAGIILQDARTGCTVLVFHSGKIILQGGTSIEEINIAKDRLDDIIDTLVRETKKSTT